MISNKKNGLSVSLVATRVMPSLLPQTMNPSLSLEQFTNLLEVLQEMLELIDRWRWSLFITFSLSLSLFSMLFLSFFFFINIGRPASLYFCILLWSSRDYWSISFVILVYKKRKGINGFPLGSVRIISLFIIIFYYYFFLGAFSSLCLFIYPFTYLFIHLSSSWFFVFFSLSLSLSLALLDFNLILRYCLNVFELRHQRNKLKLDNLSLASPERLRALRHQHSTDNMHAPNFNIPFVKVEQRKTCSEENMIKTHSSSNAFLPWSSH